MTREFIGTNLRRARQTLRLSQTTVANYLGLSRQAVSGAESGKRAITVDELLKLCDLYRVPLDSLIRPQPGPSPEDFSAVQRRANASGERALDDHDASEIALFIGALRAEKKMRPETKTTVNVQRPGPFRQLNKIADELRERFGLLQPPINIYKAFSDLTVRVRMTSLNTISGAFIPASDENRAGTLINASQPADRQRFSAAHELGHCLLGHALAGTKQIVSPLGRRFSPLEVEADSFASELLMPVSLLQAEIGKLPRSEPLDALVYTLADRFLVSFQAMIYRLANLHVIAPTHKEQLLKVRPSDIEGRIKLKRKTKKVFETKTLTGICQKSFPPEVLRDADGVRQLQEVAFEEYARGIPEVERGSSAADVYEAVALWIAATHPLGVVH